MNSSSAHIPFWIKLYVGAAFLPVIVGFICTTSGCHMYRQGRITQELPQEITCQELGQNGYGDNAHVKVTDFRLSESYIYEEEFAKSEWNFVLVPVVPATQESDTPFRVAVLSREHTQEVKLEDLYLRPEIQGIIRREGSLKATMAGKLERTFPEIDSDQVVVVEIGGHFMSKTASKNLLTFGIITLTLGVAMIVSGYTFAHRAASPRGQLNTNVIYQRGKPLHEDPEYNRRPGSQYDTVANEKPRELKQPLLPPAKEEELTEFVIDEPKPAGNDLVDFVLEENRHSPLPGSSEIIDAEIVDDDSGIIDAEILDDDFFS